MTHGQVSGRWEQSDSCYRAAAFRRSAEMWADVVAPASESRLSARLAERFAPRLHAETMKALKNIPLRRR